MKWRTCSLAIGTLAAWLVTARALDAAVLRSADVVVSIRSPRTCAVVVSFELETSKVDAIDHRLMLNDGTTVENIAVTGATAGPLHRVGTTLSLPISFDRPGPQRYFVHYEAGQAETWAGRCPVWVPSAATDGLGRVVRLTVALQEGARRLSDQFPAFKWDSGRGVVSLRHVPAFLYVPTVTAGEPPSWREAIGLRRVVDVMAIVFVVVASLIWAGQRGRR